VLRKLVLSLLLAWAGYAALCEVGRAVAGFDARATTLASPIGWRHGMPQVERLERFADAARPLLPPGSAVVFATPEDTPDQQLFRFRWASYLLPEVDLIPLSDPAAGTLGRYVLGYRRRMDHPRLELLRRLPGGWLYRVRP